ncbi:MAG: propionyl-CoA synthetase, partial [Paracoccaceae bacterium]|nr:propionyl-CoA synthetase [Paracoccaceae bacterium]
MAYKDVYAGWKADPEGFWMEQARAIDWVKPPSKALFADNAPLYEWYKDAQVNTCWNAVDRHVEAGNGDRVAIIHDSPVTNTVHKITYAELQTRVA